LNVEKTNRKKFKRIQSKSKITRFLPEFFFFERQMPTPSCGGTWCKYVLAGRDLLRYMSM